MTDFADYLDPEGRPRVPTSDEAPATPSLPATALNGRGRRDAAREPGTGRFKATQDASTYQPVGSAAQTGAIDMNAVLRGLADLERRDAHAWPKALVQTVAIIAIVGLVAFLAFLVVHGHLFGL